MNSAQDRTIVAKRADQIATRRLHWLWPERIPLGKITTFAGLPGEGKSLATVDIAARVSTGREYPDSENPLTASEVLFVAEEDDAQDALIPRLTAAGADLSKVHILEAVRVNGREGNGSLCLDVDVGAIGRFLDQHSDVRLVIIDPISNHLGRVSMVDEQEVRAILGPFQEIANARKVAVVGVIHLNKKEGLSAIHRVGGAGAFVGVARASWLFTRDPEAADERLMLPLKNNYARKSSSLGYRVNERPVQIENDQVPMPYIEWLGQTDLDADEIISMPKKHTPRADAKALLKNSLATGPQDASTVLAAAARQGISERTLVRAKKELGVESRKKGTEGWEWVLPNSEPKNVNFSQAGVGILGALQRASS